LAIQLINPAPPLSCVVRNDMNQKFLLIFFCLFTLAIRLFALGQVQYVAFNSAKDSFPIVEKGTAANLYVETNDFAGVIRAAGDLQADSAA